MKSLRNIFISCITKKVDDDSIDVLDAIGVEPEVLSTTHYGTTPKCEVCDGGDMVYAMPIGKDVMTVCPDHLQELRDSVQQWREDRLFLAAVKYRMAKESYDLAIQDKGKHLLDTMTYLRCWCEDIIDGGNKVFFLGRDMDIFHYLMISYYKYDPRKVVYLGGWNRDFAYNRHPTKKNTQVPEPLRNSQKEALCRHYDIQDGDGVVDTGFAGHIPDDIKKFKDIKALLLTKDSRSIFPWIEYISCNGESDNANLYRRWVVDIEHALKGKTVVLPHEKFFIPIETYREDDEISNWRWRGHLLGFHLAMRKAEKYDKRAARERKKNWVYNPAIKVATSCMSCESCLCKKCFKHVYKDCATTHCPPTVNGQCDVKMEGYCYGFVDEYNIEPLGKVACNSCYCNFCDIRDTCKTHDGMGCWGCNGRYDADPYKANCDEYSGNKVITRCGTCKCFECGKKFSCATTGGGCSNSQCPSCHQYKKPEEECSEYVEKTCDKCSCNACKKMTSCVGCNGSMPETSTCYSFIHECGAQELNSDESAPKGKTSADGCSACTCADCTKAGNSCPCGKASGVIAHTTNCADFCTICTQKTIKLTIEHTVEDNFSCQECACNGCIQSVIEGCGPCKPDDNAYCWVSWCDSEKKKIVEANKIKPEKKFDCTWWCQCKNCKKLFTGDCDKQCTTSQGEDCWEFYCKQFDAIYTESTDISQWTIHKEYQFNLASGGEPIDPPTEKKGDCNKCICTNCYECKSEENICLGCDTEIQFCQHYEPCNTAFEVTDLSPCEHDSSDIDYFDYF